MLPEGNYRAVSSLPPEWGFTQKGHEVVKLNFKITQGEYEGHHIEWRGYFSPKAEDRTCESLRHCGWKGDNILELGDLDQEVEIQVGHEEYEGKVFARCNWVNSGTSSSSLGTPMSDDQKRMFAARMKAKASMPAADAPPHPAEDDDPPWL